MNKLIEAIRVYRKSGEELKVIAQVAALENKLPVTIEEGRELMNNILQGELDGGRAERAILEAVALRVSMETLKRKIALENTN